MKFKWQSAEWLSKDAETLVVVCKNNIYWRTWFFVIPKPTHVLVLKNDKILEFDTMDQAKAYCEVCYMMGVEL